MEGTHLHSPQHTDTTFTQHKPKHKPKPSTSEDDALLEQLERNSWMIQSALSTTPSDDHTAAAGSGKQAVLALKNKHHPHPHPHDGPQPTAAARLLPDWQQRCTPDTLTSPKSRARCKCKRKGKGKTKAKTLKRLTKKDQYIAEAQAEALRLEREIRHRLKMEAKRWSRERKERRMYERQQARARTKAIQRQHERLRRKRVERQRLKAKSEGYRVFKGNLKAGMRLVSKQSTKGKLYSTTVKQREARQRWKTPHSEKAPDKASAGEQPEPFLKDTLNGAEVEKWKQTWEELRSHDTIESSPRLGLQREPTQQAPQLQELFAVCKSPNEDRYYLELHAPPRARNSVRSLQKREVSDWSLEASSPKTGPSSPSNMIYVHNFIYSPTAAKQRKVDICRTSQHGKEVSEERSVTTTSHNEEDNVKGAGSGSLKCDNGSESVGCSEERGEVSRKKKVKEDFVTESTTLSVVEALVDLDGRISKTSTPRDDVNLNLALRKDQNGTTMKEESDTLVNTNTPEVINSQELAPSEADDKPQEQHTLQVSASLEVLSASPQHNLDAQHKCSCFCRTRRRPDAAIQTTPSLELQAEIKHEVQALKVHNSSMADGSSPSSEERSLEEQQLTSLKAKLTDQLRALAESLPATPVVSSDNPSPLRPFSPEFVPINLALPDASERIAHAVDGLPRFSPIDKGIGYLNLGIQSERKLLHSGETQTPPLHVQDAGAQVNTLDSARKVSPSHPSESTLIQEESRRCVSPNSEVRIATASWPKPQHNTQARRRAKSGEVNSNAGATNHEAASKQPVAFKPKERYGEGDTLVESSQAHKQSQKYTSIEPDDSRAKIHVPHDQKKADNQDNDTTIVGSALDRKGEVVDGANGLSTNGSSLLNPLATNPQASTMISQGAYPMDDRPKPTNDIASGAVGVGLLAKVEAHLGHEGNPQAEEDAPSSCTTGRSVFSISTASGSQATLLMSDSEVSDDTGIGRRSSRVNETSSVGGASTVKLPEEPKAVPNRSLTTFSTAATRGSIGSIDALSIDPSEGINTTSNISGVNQASNEVTAATVEVDPADDANSTLNQSSNTFITAEPRSATASTTHYNERSSCNESETSSTHTANTVEQTEHDDLMPNRSVAKLSTAATRGSVNSIASVSTTKTNEALPLDQSADQLEQETQPGLHQASISSTSTPPLPHLPLLPANASTTGIASPTRDQATPPTSPVAKQREDSTSARETTQTGRLPSSPDVAIETIMDDILNGISSSSSPSPSQPPSLSPSP